MDTDIRTAVSRELAADPHIDADDIDIEVVNGDVSLNGTVPSQAQRSEAVAAVSRVAGVTAVRDLLAVALPGDDYGDDTALARTANDALAVTSTVPAGVRATASQGNIFLTGAVSSDGERTAAEDTVAGVAGVLSITNQIEVLG